MIAYAICFLATQTRQPDGTMVLVVALAALIPGIAGFSGFGLVAYWGYRLNVLSIIARFLVLAVGIDDAFLLTSCFRAVGHRELDHAAAQHSRRLTANPATPHPRRGY